MMDELLKKLDGYKTLIGGVGAVASIVAWIIDPNGREMWMTCMLAFLGFAGLGISHKLQKLQNKPE